MAEYTFDLGGRVSAGGKGCLNHQLEPCVEIGVQADPSAQIAMGCSGTTASRLHYSSQSTYVSHAA